MHIPEAGSTFIVSVWKFARKVGVDVILDLFEM